MIKYTVGEIEEKLKEKDLVIKSNTTHCKNKLISNLTDNSKEVKENTLFICKGAHFKKEYLLDAMDKGTICYITDNENLLGFGEYIYVSDIRKATLEIIDFLGCLPKRVPKSIVELLYADLSIRNRISCIAPILLNSFSTCTASLSRSICHTF